MQMKIECRRSAVLVLILLLTTLLHQLLAQASSTRNSLDYDVITKNGKIIDGSGNPWVSGDIAIRGERIAATGHFAPTAHAKRVIDARGLMISPGFIDMLGQSEVALLVDNRSLSKLSMGKNPAWAAPSKSRPPVHCSPALVWR